MSNQFGSQSRTNLAKCHPELQAIARQALQASAVDFTVTSGAGLSLAVAPYPADPSLEKYQIIVAAFRQVAKSLGLTLRWSGDFKAFADPSRFEIDEPAGRQWSASSQIAAPEPVPTQTQAIPDRAALSGLSEADLLARVIWGECRGKLPEEARAIAHVVVNRAAKPGWWGKDIKGCCLAKAQFSCLNSVDPNLPKILKGDFRDGSWATCLTEAAAAVAGESQDPTGGATSYHAASMNPFPSWAKALTPTARIGSHIFYREA
jgi:hypothetical protein